MDRLIDVSKEMLIKKIGNHEYVSFDLFDTLLKRTVLAPTDIFMMVGLQVKERQLSDLAPEEFYKKRIAAEQRARDISAYEEITLDEIYNCFLLRKRDAIKMLEMETEKRCIQANRNMLPILHWCAKHKKKIILISDMYLPESFIEQILQSLNICYHYLFLSSTYRASKHRGTLYDIVLKEMKIHANQMIHIGDNLKADYLVPKTKHIAAVWIKKDVNSTQFYKIMDAQNITDRILKGFINNQICGESLYYKFGYECMGPVLYQFTHWLYDECEKEGIDRLFFLSREGKIMLDAFELLYPHKKEAKYLLVSRHSISIPLLCTKLSFEEKMELIPSPRLFTVERLLEMLGVEKENFELEDKDVYSKNDFYYNHSAVQRIKQYNDLIMQNSKKQKENIRAYFEQIGMKGKVGIIDIGWKGSMQNYLEQLSDALGIDVDINGFYLGIEKNHRLLPGSKAKGYAFDQEADEVIGHKMMGFAGLMENIFTAEHGSVKSYISNNEEIKAEFYPWEFIAEEFSSIREIQKGGLDFLKHIIKFGFQENLRLSRERALYNLLEFGSNPTLMDIKLFKKLNFYDTKTTKMVGEPIKKMWEGIGALKYDFMGCGWKIGYMKNLFKVPFPYGKLFVTVRRKKKSAVDNE